MRQELLDPLTDFPQYQVARQLVNRIYECRQAGADYSGYLAELNSLCKQRLTAWDIDAAAELIEPDEYVYEVLADLVATPADLSYGEMLELVEELKANVAENGIQAGHWVRCLEVNTGTGGSAACSRAGPRHTSGTASPGG